MNMELGSVVNEPAGAKAMAGNAKQVVEIMADCRSDAAAQIRGMRSFQMMLEFGAVQQKLLTKAGACEALTAAMTSHASNLELQGHAALTVALLSQGPCQEAQAALLSCGATECLLSALRSGLAGSAPIDELVASSMTGLATLCQSNYRGCQQAVEFGVPRVVLEAMSIDFADSLVLEHAFELVETLALAMSAKIPEQREGPNPGPNAADAEPVFGGCELIELVTAVLSGSKGFPKDPQLQISCCNVIRSLAELALKAGDKSLLQDPTWILQTAEMLPPPFSASVGISRLASPCLSALAAGAQLDRSLSDTLLTARRLPSCLLDAVQRATGAGKRFVALRAPCRLISALCEASGEAAAGSLADAGLIAILVEALDLSRSQQTIQDDLVKSLHAMVKTGCERALLALAETSFAGQAEASTTTKRMLLKELQDRLEHRAR